MLKAGLNSSFYQKNAVTEYFTKALIIFVKSQKFIMQCVFCVSFMLFPTDELKSKQQENIIQNYVRSGTTLKARKRKAYMNAQKVSGRKIKRYLISKSVLQSRKGRANAATRKMVESGPVTLELVKKNRWFVKKPIQTSYTKLPDIKQYVPPKPDLEKSKKISRSALTMTKNRARITGPVKPDSLYSSNDSRGVLKMTKTRARAAGPVKPGIVYAEDVSRGAMKISKNRAVITGPVKPKILYSDQVSRDAKKISLKTSRDFTTARREMSYNSDMLKSIAKRPEVDYKPINVKTASEKKDTEN